MPSNRRHFLKQLGGLAAGFGAASTGLSFITSPNDIQTNAHTSANDVAAPPFIFYHFACPMVITQKVMGKGNGQSRFSGSSQKYLRH
jgi:hypothetical protein